MLVEIGLENPIWFGTNLCVLVLCYSENKTNLKVLVSWENRGLSRGYRFNLTPPPGFSHKTAGLIHGLMHNLFLGGVIALGIGCSPPVAEAS